ncbi:MAG: hypothetical protein EA402_04215 [Planctomycetota bacterium]|nr:MAG: hypothetical protein EA402_04215 [Planctomycetota bacterium]
MNNYSDLSDLSELNRHIDDLRIRMEERLKANRERFNVFSTLLNAGDEVRLHTRFLHELLNPLGTHDCGRLFLDLFWSTLSENPPVDHDDEPIDPISLPGLESGPKWQVWREATRGDLGRIDLLMECAQRRVAIENKIWALEQPSQIARYHTYCKECGPDSIVMYLTLDGKKSCSHQGMPYFRISYCIHILSWLERCLQASYAWAPVNQVLQQYHRLVERLTGKTLERTEMNAIETFIRNHPSIITNAAAINTAVENLKHQQRESFGKKLLESLKSKIPSARFRPKMGKKDSFADDFNPGVVFDHCFGQGDQSLSVEIWIEHHARRDLIIGIESKWKKESTSKLAGGIFSSMRKILTEKETDPTTYCHNQKTWHGTHWPLGWRILVSDFLYADEDKAKNFDDSDLQSTINGIVEGAMKFLEDINSVYQQACKLTIDGDQ